MNQITDKRHLRDHRYSSARPHHPIPMTNGEAENRHELWLSNYAATLNTDIAECHTINKSIGVFPTRVK